MYSRRAILLGGGTGVTLSLAGCLDVITGEEPLEFTAAPAAPSDETLESTGYDAESLEGDEIEETVSVGGVERELIASFWSGTYTKELEASDLEGAGDDEVDLEGEADDADPEAVESEEENVPGAQFVVVSMPGMEVAGSDRNPIADMDNEELLEDMFEDEVDGDLDTLEHQESRSHHVLGDDRTVDVFDAETETDDGEEVSLTLYMTTVSNEDDILVIFGGHPTDVEGEVDSIASLFESVEHPLEPAEFGAE